MCRISPYLYSRWIAWRTLTRMGVWFLSGPALDALNKGVTDESFDSVDTALSVSKYCICVTEAADPVGLLFTTSVCEEATWRSKKITYVRIHLVRLPLQSQSFSSKRHFVPSPKSKWSCLERRSLQRHNWRLSTTNDETVATAISTSRATS